MTDTIGLSEEERVVKKLHPLHGPVADKYHRMAHKLDGQVRSLQEENKELQSIKGILAVLHRDGGRHTEKVGVEQSVEDGHKVWAALIGERDELGKRIGKAQSETLRLRKALEAVRAISPIHATGSGTSYQYTSEAQELDRKVFAIIQDALYPKEEEQPRQVLTKSGMDHIRDYRKEEQQRKPVLNYLPQAETAEKLLNELETVEALRAKPFKLVARTLAGQINYCADYLGEESAIPYTAAGLLRGIATQVDAIERSIEALSKLAKRD